MLRKGSGSAAGGGTPDWSAYVNPGHRMVVTTVRVAGRLSKAADRFLSAYNLTLAQFDILAVLIQVPDGLPQTRLGDQLVVSRANVTGLVRRLKAQGLCFTVSDPADARIKKVKITAKGRRLMNRIYGPYVEEISRRTAQLADGDMDKVSDVLEQLDQEELS